MIKLTWSFKLADIPADGAAMWLRKRGMRRKPEAHNSAVKIGRNVISAKFPVEAFGFRIFFSRPSHSFGVMVCKLGFSTSYPSDAQSDKVLGIAVVKATLIIMNAFGKSAIGLSHTSVFGVFRQKANAWHPSVDAWRDRMIKEFVK